jgi:hypothetical protein
MSALRDILALSASVLTDADRELHSRTRSDRRHRIGAWNFGNADRHRRTRPDTSPISLFFDQPAGIAAPIERRGDRLRRRVPRRPPLNYGSSSRTA